MDKFIKKLKGNKEKEEDKQSLLSNEPENTVNDNKEGSTNSTNKGWGWAYISKQVKIVIIIIHGLLYRRGRFSARQEW